MRPIWLRAPVDSDERITGVRRHACRNVGLWSHVLDRTEYGVGGDALPG